MRAAKVRRGQGASSQPMEESHVSFRSTVDSSEEVVVVKALRRTHFRAALAAATVVGLITTVGAPFKWN